MRFLRSLTPEQQFLLREARYVWRERATAKRAGLPWREETITDILLKRLRLGYPGGVEVIPFNKQLEGESGADWLWSFVSADGANSMTMLVQAKRLDDREIGYPDIARAIGRRTPPERQIDRLIEIADQHNVPALYAFYNHLTSRSRIPRRCGSLPPHSPDHVLGLRRRGEMRRPAPPLGHAIPLRSADSCARPARAGVARRTAGLRRSTCSFASETTLDLHHQTREVQPNRLDRGTAAVTRVLDGPGVDAETVNRHE